MTILLPKMAEQLEATGAQSSQDAIAVQVKLLLGHENDKDRPFWWREWSGPEGPKRVRISLMSILSCRTNTAHILGTLSVLPNPFRILFPSSGCLLRVSW